MPTAKRLIVGASLLIAGIAVALWLFRHFSPHNICVRYYTTQAVEEGQSLSSAEIYAENLCAAKNPLRN